MYQNNNLDEFTEEILKELDNIYGAERTKETFKNYIMYTRLKKEGKVKFGTYNMYIRNKSKMKVPEELIKIICKILKTNNVITTSYKYLEKNKKRSRRKKDDDIDVEEEKVFQDIKEDVCVIDRDRANVDLTYGKNDIRNFINENPRKVYIFIDKENSRSFFYDDEESLECIEENYGDLVSWTIDIEEGTRESNIKYINKFLKQNSIKVDNKSTFVECLAREKYCKIKTEIQSIVLECKANGISKITDSVIENQLKKKYFKKSNKSKMPPMKELESMIGIKDVKKQVEQIMNFVKINKEKGSMPGLHMCFLGNPGTGKTTVARIIGRLFAEMKILSEKEVFVEAQRVDLIGQYVGSTAPKTKAKVEEAKGGVLFIDEAYSLCPKDYGLDYGIECVSTLIKEMEDKRDNLCVILAGYTKETKEMLEINPGFESRIQFYINFPDYTAEELYEIYKKMAKDEKYKVSGNDKDLLIDYFEKERIKPNFANARCVRNLFEKIKFAQADRIVKENSQDLYSIKRSDVQEVLKKIEENEKLGKKKVQIGFSK